MFHFQVPVPDWPRAAEILPVGYLIKAIDNVQMLDEAKRHNPNLITDLRHYVAHQHPGNTLDENIILARQFFDTFIDGTFMEYAHNVDYIEDWNEYFGNTQSPEEKQRFIFWAMAAVRVWALEYRSRPGLGHIRLIVGNTAIGNDIPLDVAQAASSYDAVVGYHPYWPVRYNNLLPDEWIWYSGRWTVMDDYYRQEGYTVDWAFTEAGSIRYWLNGGVSLDPYGGWRHPECHDYNLNEYLLKIKYWMDNWYAWNQSNNDRALPPVLFNSNLGGGAWAHFNLVQPQLDIIAEFVSRWVPQTPEPPGGECRGAPRIQYHRVYNVLSSHIDEATAQSIFVDAMRHNKQTVGFSYDDAGIGDLDNRLARLHGIPANERQTFIEWYNQNYPGVVIEFVD